MKKQRALLALVSTFSAPLWAHPLDDASIWMYDGARLGAKTPPAMVTQSATTAQPATDAPSGAPATFFMTVFPENGERRDAPDAPAQSAADAEEGANPKGQRHAWTAALGYRRERLDFNIAGPGGTPNVLSELKWETEMAEFRLNGDWMAANGFTVAGELAYASGFSGKVRDSDYVYSGRRGEFSRSYSKPHGSTESRATLGLGWRIMPHSRIGVTPMAGYAYQEQDLRSRHGRQVVSDFGFGVPLGPIHGLDSHYRPRWHGPWLGLRLDAHLGKRFDLRFGLKQQWYRYRAEADWNLRSNFEHPVSFRHHGSSSGWQAEIGALWHLSAQSAITFTLDRSEQRLRNGTDRTFFSSGESTKTRLNGVNWDSWAGALGWRLDF
ncbi:MAG: hypothetical protein LBL48_10610 [Azoarcus sp.]|jgi:hypothetical protein|nr:hypothetical protein [Azoarcus sp.]